MVTTSTVKYVSTLTRCSCPDWFGAVPRRSPASAPATRFARWLRKSTTARGELAPDVFGPLVHELPPPLEQITSEVRPLDAADDVR